MRIRQRDNTGWEALSDDWPVCLRKALAARGIQTVEALYYPLTALPEPEQLMGMSAALDLLYQAFTLQQRVMIVADFDSDGATSCALAIRGLKAMGLQQLSYIVPNRFKHGYGLSPALVDAISTRQPPDLLITVDNGIAAIDGVIAAQQRGMKVLITDHHLPGDSLPTAEAIVNPNQPNDNFASKAMAGVGVCFYLLLGLRRHLREQGWFQQQGIDEPRLTQWLDLVALGTVADVVPLDRLNRSLVQWGIQRIRKGQACSGIQALIQLAERDYRQLVSSDLGFSIAPRLNAAGRMEDMSLGIDLLLTDDRSQALKMATQLNDINQQRRAVEHTMQQEALQMLEDIQLQADAEQVAYCFYDADWHQGVIGLLASRIKDKVHRPVVVFADGESGELKGSARSIAGIHIRDVLALVAAKYPHLLTTFGGHAMAAGMTIKAAHFTAFQQAFTACVQQLTEPAVFQRQLDSDGELAADELTLGLAEQLPAFAPWGQGFEEPRFHGVFKVIEWRELGKEANHLRLLLALADQRQISAIAFFQQRPDWLVCGGKVLLHYRLAVNAYAGKRSLQLMVDHLLAVDA